MPQSELARLDIEQGWTQERTAQRLTRRDKDRALQAAVVLRGLGPINRELLVVGLGAGNVNVRKEPGKRGENPSPRRPATPARIGLTGVKPVLLHQVHFIFAAERDTGLQHQAPAALRGEKLKRAVGLGEVIQQAVAVHDFEGRAGQRLRGLDIEGDHRPAGITSGQDRKIFRPGLRDGHRTAAVEVVAGVVTDAGPYFQHAAAGRFQLEAGEVLQPAGVVPQVFSLVEHLFRGTKPAEFECVPVKYPFHRRIDCCGGWDETS